jgi:hypothetical protein
MAEKPKPKPKSKGKKTIVVANMAPTVSTGALTTAAQTEVVNEVSQAAAQSLAFFATRQAQVAAYGDFDTFVDRQDDDKIGRAIEHHIVRVRAALASSLWRRQIFLGVDVIDRLLFDILSVDTTKVLQDFFGAMFAHGVPSAGLVVYPLHSFGVLGLGLFMFLTKTRPEIVLKDAKMAVCAQTNQHEASIAFLERTVVALGLDRRIDRSDIDHYVRSRSLKWFENNPLLVVSISTLTSGYYENQFIYILKLKLSTALIMMLSAVGDQAEPNERLLAGSSSRVNNWQTLDIHHYLVFEPSLSDPTMLEARCVPMNAARLQLAELSDLNAEIDPRAWTKRRAGRQLEAIRTALAAVEAGYLEHHVLGKKGKLKARIYRKLIDSLDYFRRAYSAGAKESEATVSLAIAFETLLMDAYASGVTRRLHRRVHLALKGVPGIRKYRAAVVGLFKARGAIVHSGRPDTDFDMLDARRAYVNCFIAVAGKLGALPNKDEHPIGRLLGDLV